MSCENCDGICKRRGLTMPEHHRFLCSTQVKYARFFDKSLGVEDETVIPDSYMQPVQAIPVPERATKNKRPGVKTKKGLGDRIETALASVGVTPERVEKWIGGPCGCPERKEKFNKLGEWIGAFFPTGSVSEESAQSARMELETMLADSPKKRTQRKRNHDGT